MARGRVLALIAAGLGAAAIGVAAMHAMHDRSRAASSVGVGGRPARPAPHVATPALGAVDRASELDDYLRDIEVRAGRDPEVAGMEIEHGIEAIHRLADQLGYDRAEQMQREFAERMRRIIMAENADVRPDEMASLAARYEQTRDARERDRLRRRYVAALGKLGATERASVLDRLRRYLQ